MSGTEEEKELVKQTILSLLKEQFDVEEEDFLSAELEIVPAGKARAVFDKENVGFQTGELGKVDLGGGGTIAFIMANYGMHVIDSGVAVLSMHAPYEVTSKADVYEAYCGYKAFLANME
ncbi:Aminopeptidase I zinc metalloprotease (M18) [Hespellia stercorisuis DSM 15480]|uniref:Aminopeptidase I zinc metalloprotease (M18) n=1 Tax=Hespellia stercorisuis DSM 15480 TaxID=1121950 RepID=A0A1M6JM82_9FIRM|nr:hypothetical protein [Hespellia stercorisuis]SHJ47829.1 Aminopeptidase I zinc metalloprotease (M18) [Hespellia stercorisuis DSM 15480]